MCVNVNECDVKNITTGTTRQVMKGNCDEDRERRRCMGLCANYYRGETRSTGQTRKEKPNPRSYTTFDETSTSMVVVGYPMSVSLRDGAAVGGKV